MTPCERWRVTQRDDPRPVQGGEEDTEERVMTSHTEKCETSENCAKESQEAKEKRVAEHENRSTTKGDETTTLERQVVN